MLLEIVLSVLPAALSVTLIVAPGMRAPEESLTVPRSEVVAILTRERESLGPGCRSAPIPKGIVSRLFLQKSLAVYGIASQLLVRSTEESGALETPEPVACETLAWPLVGSSQRKKVKLQRLPRSGIETCVVRE